MRLQILLLLVLTISCKNSHAEREINNELTFNAKKHFVELKNNSNQISARYELYHLKSGDSIINQKTKYLDRNVIDTLNSVFYDLSIERINSCYYSIKLFYFAEHYAEYSKTENLKHNETYFIFREINKDSTWITKKKFENLTSINLKFENCISDKLSGVLVNKFYNEKYQRIQHRFTLVDNKNETNSDFYQYILNMKR